MDNQSFENKILIVDDEEATRELLYSLLEGEGYKIKSAKDGEEALNTALSFKPNLVLLDIMLPGINGIDVCKKIKSSKDGHLISVLMLTARDDVRDIVDGLNQGADDYLTKPFDLKELLARVKALMRINILT
ncbi:MAG: response regulator, partial [Candidatus Dadabacteria bacterium]